MNQVFVTKIMENFVLILLAIAIGYFINRLNIFSKDAPAILNQFAIYISLPAMIILQVPKLSFSIDMIIPIIVAWLVAHSNRVNLIHWQRDNAPILIF